VSTAARLLGLRVRIESGTWMFVVSIVCCQVVVSATGRSLVQSSPTECGVPECDRETSLKKSRLTEVFKPWGEEKEGAV
jgi:hypothetical protein